MIPGLSVVEGCNEKPGMIPGQSTVEGCNEGPVHVLAQKWEREREQACMSVVESGVEEMANVSFREIASRQLPPYPRGPS